MITKFYAVLKPIWRAIVMRMFAECEGRIAFNKRQINYDIAKLAEYNSKPSLNFLQSRDMIEREALIRFNEKQLARDRSGLEDLKEKLRKLQN